MSGAVVATTAAAAERVTEVVDLLSDGETTPRARRSGARAAGASQAPGPAAGGRRRVVAHQRQHPQQQQQHPQPASGQAQDEDVIDLTRPNADADVQVVRSTVQRVPMRGVKRPRPTALQQLSPMKQLLLQQLRNPPSPLPPDPEPEGPKCGICLEPMGGSHGRQMASGTCGHVYCYDCLTAAVRTQKKCPTCRKTMQPRQIHKVFLNMQ